jgi:hypothetical protein
MAKTGLKIRMSSFNTTVANGMGAARQSNVRSGETPSLLALLPDSSSPAAGDEVHQGIPLLAAPTLDKRLGLLLLAER